MSNLIQVTLKERDDIELTTEKPHNFISHCVGKGAWISLLCFLSPDVSLVTGTAGAIVWHAGRDIGGSIKSDSIPQPVDQIPGLKEGSRRKKLASGFHFIPHRLNEAHGEGTGVTFSG